MDSNLQISVVMATYNRADTLRRTLGHLFSQTLDATAYEVIVVDDGSPDHTQQLVEEMTPQAPCHIVYLRHANRGPGYAQNRGIRKAKAPLVLLIADDIFLTPEALEAHLAAHERHPDLETAILGQVLQSPELNQSQFIRKWDPFKLGSLRQDEELQPMMFWACNISFKLDFMLAHGMFRDEVGRAGPARHEDVEVGYRLAEHGLRIFHETGALGYHYHLDSLEDATARSHHRGLNWGEFRQRLDAPELDLHYRVYNLRTLFGVYRKATAKRQTPMFPFEPSIAVLAFRCLVRSVLFNGLTVPRLWLPLMSLAERNRLVATAIRPRFYASVCGYFFRKGHRDAEQTPYQPWSWHDGEEG